MGNDGLKQHERVELLIGALSVLAELEVDPTCSAGQDAAERVVGRLALSTIELRALAAMMRLFSSRRRDDAVGWVLTDEWTEPPA
jgi:hypothetical protein